MLITQWSGDEKSGSEQHLFKEGQLVVACDKDIDMEADTGDINDIDINDIDANDIDVDTDADVDADTDSSSSTDRGPYACIITSESLQSRVIPIAKQAIANSQMDPIAANTANVDKPINPAGSWDKHEKSNKSERVHRNSPEAEPKQKDSPVIINIANW